ncbi:MAG: sigma-70 family RNA polymerase sigma factor [Ruminococcaceae bacterium]|nr:sigma-70 family RNA polymerase sigma factor [Oscillospiraceae bacterium]
MEDLKIISLYTERNENAIKETEIKYGKLLNKISYEILRNDRDTEECVNSTYLNTWNAIPPTIPKSLCSFVCRIARNVALNILKKLNRHRAENIYDELEEIIGDNNDPQDIIEANALTTLIDTYLDTVKSRNRQIFVMRYYYNMSMKAIGDCFNLNEQAVRSQLMRTRDGLRNYLRENGMEL